MFDLVTRNEQGEPVTTSLAIAEGVDRSHRSMIQLIRQNISELQEFGPLAFEMRVIRADGRGGQEAEVALLNEGQATLILALMRNIGVVKKFKVQLVREFYRMRDQLRVQQPAFQLPDFTNPAIAARAWAEQHEQRVEAERQIERDAPAVRFAHQVRSADDALTVARAAKLLGTGQKRLFALLRERRWISRSNEPYQRAIDAGLLNLKLGSWTHPDLGLQQSCTTIVTAKGMIKLQRILQVSTALLP